MSEVAREPLRILVVDDDEVFRDSLQMLLDRDERVVVVGLAHDQPSALAAVGTGIDVAVVDVRIGRTYGFEIVESLRASLPDAVVMMMSGLDVSEYQADAVRAGAHAVVAKSAIARDGVDAILRNLA
jgi:DNA-binding NarL/FixJ family response regulator